MLFKDTAVGRFIYVYAPTQYVMLMRYCKDGIKNGERTINYFTLESMAHDSSEPAFRSARFRKAMISYRLFKNRPKRKAQWTVTDALYYAKYAYPVYAAIEQYT